MSIRESISATGRVVLISIFLWLIWLAILVALCSCSSIDRVRSAEAEQTAAMSKVVKAAKAKTIAIKAKDKDTAALSEQTADYNRELRYAVGLQPTPAVQGAELKLLDLQFQLTGPADLGENDQQKVVESLIAGGQKAERENEELTQKNADLEKHVTDDNAKIAAADEKISAAEAQVAKTTATLYSVAEFSASKADELSGWISTLWTVGIGITVLGGGLFAFYLFTKFGIKTAEATTAVAAKVP